MSCGYELSHGSESIIRENYLTCLVWTSYFVTLLYTSAIILIHLHCDIFLHPLQQIHSQSPLMPNFLWHYWSYVLF